MLLVMALLLLIERGIGQECQMALQVSGLDDGQIAPWSAEWPDNVS